jgi:hypothetical protein
MAIAPLALAARRAALFAVLALVGCSPPQSEQAERELALIKESHGDADQICAATRKVADAYLHENNARKYELADVEAKLACNKAAMDRL